MLRVSVALGLVTSVALLALVLASTGCSTSVSQDAAKATPPATAAREKEPGCCEGHGHAHSASGAESKSQAAACCDEAEEASDVREELAKLPAEDRVLAKKQKVCPVTNAPLGSMGVPCKVTLKGQTVFLCCEGCEGKLQKNADKYLAKLNQSQSK